MRILSFVCKPEGEIEGKDETKIDQVLVMTLKVTPRTWNYTMEIQGRNVLRGYQVLFHGKCVKIYVYNKKDMSIMSGSV